jgi:general secretion pathway protein C
MGTDALLKRFFPAVVLVLIGVAGYFQASGLARLVAGGLALDPSSVAAVVAPAMHSSTPAPANTHHSTDGLAILSRNPFDSATDLMGEKRPPSHDDPMVQSGDAMPTCDAARVVLITWSEDPQWSFASIAGGNGKSTLRRQGDEMNGYKVDEIEWDRVSMTSSAGQRCQMIIGGQITTDRAGGRGKPPVVPPGKVPKSLEVPEEIKSKIHQIDPNHFEVERSVIQDILAMQAQLLGRTRAVADKDGGLRLSGIRPGSLLGSLGIANGDCLQSINGIDVGDTTKIMQAYPGLLTAGHLSVTMNRSGKPSTIEINLK